MRHVIVVLGLTDCPESHKDGNGHVRRSLAFPVSYIVNRFESLLAIIISQVARKLLMPPHRYSMIQLEYVASLLH